MITRTFKTALWVTGLIHFIIIILFTLDFYGDQEEYGNDYWEHVVWSEYMFMVFIPITYSIVFSFVLIIQFLNQKKYDG